MNHSEDFIEVIRGFSAIEKDFGVRNPGEEIPYSFTFNSANHEVHCWTGSCGCTGGALSGSKGSQEIKGVWHLPKAEHLVRNAGETNREQVQTITVEMDPSIAFFDVNENGQKIANQQKLKVDLKLKASIKMEGVAYSPGSEPQVPQAIPTPAGATIMAHDGSVVRNSPTQMNVTS